MEKTQKTKSKKSLTIYNIVMSFILLCTMIIGSFAYWKNENEVKIPTFGFNATEEEFSYYACVPNLAANTGYDYYDIDYIPEDLINRVVGLACVRYEALTKTAYIPPYPVIRMHGQEYNSEGNPKLPVIHLLNSVQINNSTVDNGFLTIENLIIPDTITFIQPGSFKTSELLSEVSFLGDDTSGNVFYNHDELAGKAVRYQHANRNIIYRISPETRTQIKMMQFMEGGELEFENSSKKFITYIIPNTPISDLTVQEVDNNSVVKPLGPNPKAQEPVPVDYPIHFDTPLEPNNVYKLSFDRDTHSMSAQKYTYMLNIKEAGKKPLNIPLKMTTAGGYESYILEDNVELGIELGTIKIEDPNAILEVYEYINGKPDADPDSTFAIADLQTDYNSDNNIYHIRYSPINVYATRHYCNDSNGVLTSNIKPRQIAVEKAYFLNKVTATTEPETATGENKPVLVQDPDIGPILMTRNYANEEFEEYIYYDYSGTNSINGSYVVSTISDPKANFGGSSNNSYYGIINETSPLGEKVLVNQNMVLFTPNRDRHYGENGERRYFGIFDQYNHLIERLSFNEATSIKKGVQSFDATIPIAKQDFTSIKVMEIYEDGTIKGDPNKPFYEESVDKLNLKPNEDISKLFTPYFLGDNSNLNGFVRTEVDANGNVYYLFQDAYVEKNQPLYVTENQSFLPDGGVPNTKIKFANLDWDLPFQVISGFFYSCEDPNKDITINATHDGFSLPKTGYYDLMLRERTIEGEKNLFIGFKYKGLKPRPQNNFFIQQLSGNTVNFTKEMTRSNNYFMSFVDFNAANNNYTYRVLDYNGTVIDADIKFEDKNFTPGYQRFYYGQDFFLNQLGSTAESGFSKSRHAQFHLNPVNVSFSFGSPSTMIRVESTFENDDGFPELIKSSASSEYVMIVQDDQKIVMPHSVGRDGKYIGYIVVTDKNKDLVIEKKGEANIPAGKVPFPGVYKVIYDDIDKSIEYTKIQKPRFYNIVLDSKVVDSLVPNTDVVKQDVKPIAGQVGHDKYLEFKSPGLINVNSDVILAPSTPAVPGEVINKLSVQDEYGNIITAIDKVTLDGKTSTVIPKGTYEFYYSIDSTRRKGDKYQVFTYFRLVTKPTGSVTYHYKTETGESAPWRDYYRQNDVTNGSYLLDYARLPIDNPSKPIQEVDFEFKGWSKTDPTSTTKPITLDYPLYVQSPYDKDKLVLNKVKAPEGKNLDLYPVFVQNEHEYLAVGIQNFDSTNYTQFTVTNIEGAKIIGAVVDESIVTMPEGYNAEDLNKYIHVSDKSNNVITLDLAFCEILGYLEDEATGQIGQAIKVKIQNSDGTTYFTTVYVPYPKFEFVGPAL